MTHNDPIRIWPWLVGAAVVAIVITVLAGIVGVFNDNATEQDSGPREAVMDETVVTSTTTTLPPLLPVEIVHAIIDRHNPPDDVFPLEATSVAMMAIFSDLCYVQLADGPVEVVAENYYQFVRSNYAAQGGDPDDLDTAGWNIHRMVYDLADLGCPDPVL